MKTFSKASSVLSLLLIAAFAISNAHAKAGATDPIPGTSKGTVNAGGGAGGGGGAKTVTPAPTPVAVSPAPTPVAAAPAPAPVVLPPAPPPAPFVTAVLTFTPVSQVNGVDPVCSGDYHIDPYYPTLSLMTVNVDTTSVNAPDGTTLFVSVTGTGGTLYPFTSDVINITGGIGLCTYNVYVTPGTVITGVNITDANGLVIASGI